MSHEPSAMDGAQTHLSIQERVHSLLQDFHPAGEAISAAAASPGGRLLHAAAQLRLKLRYLLL